MGRNLGPLNIKDSYEGLVQISGSQLTDGSGSLISSLDVTASDATSATTASYVAGANVDGTVASATSASHAVNADTAISSSFATTASFALNADPFPYTGNVGITGDINLTGSYNRLSGSFSGSAIDNITDIYTANDAIKHVVHLTQAEYDALTPSADTLYVISGSTVSDPFPYTGSAVITGSLEVTGSLVGQLGGINIGSEPNPASLLTNGNIVMGGHGLGSPTNSPKITAGNDKVLFKWHINLEEIVNKFNKI